MKTIPWSEIKHKLPPEKIEEIKEAARKEAKEMGTKTLQVTKEVTIGTLLKELLLEELGKSNLEICECSDRGEFSAVTLSLPLCEEVAKKFYKECEKNIKEESSSGPPSWQR